MDPPFQGPIRDYEEIAPPNSFLHVDNFTSVKELGDYLKYLDTNPDVYNSYHSWRDRYEIKETGGWWWWNLPRNYGEGKEGMWCKVCAAAHQLQGIKKVNFTEGTWKSDKLCRNDSLHKYHLESFNPR